MEHDLLHCWKCVLMLQLKGVGIETASRNKIVMINNTRYFRISMITSRDLDINVAMSRDVHV